MVEIHKKKKWEMKRISIYFTHDCTLLFYQQPDLLNVPNITQP